MKPSRIVEHLDAAQHVEHRVGDLLVSALTIIFHRLPRSIPQPCRGRDFGRLAPAGAYHARLFPANGEPIQRKVVWIR